jgi:hypothetical protein
MPANTPVGTPVNPLQGNVAVPVPGTVPLPTIRDAIQNPLVTTQGGASAAGQTGTEIGVQTGVQAGTPGAPPAAPAPNVQNLNVLRQDGALILSGTVHTEQDKDAAAQRAAEAAGGEQVINNIVVQ